MKIKEKLRQHRRDFTAVYVCEWCGFEFTGGGYDDAHFHQHVIPDWECSDCGQRGLGPSSMPDVPAGVIV